MTPASRQALEGLRDLSMLKWYVIPLHVRHFGHHLRQHHLRRPEREGHGMGVLKPAFEIVNLLESNQLRSEC